METKQLGTTEQDLALAGELLRQGQLVAFPTETVYGLGADALNETAVAQIYAAKGRPSDNPLIVHVAEKADIAPLVREIPEKAKKLFDRFFPGPLTVILPKSDKIGKVVSGGLDTVAVRMPENPVAHRLLQLAGVPVAAPSANTSGLPSPTRAKYVQEDMNGKIAAIVDGGDCAYGVESTVITLATSTPTLLRPGAVTKEMLEAEIGPIAVAPAVLEKMADGETAASPGMKYKHYAPKADVTLLNGTFAHYAPKAQVLLVKGDSAAYTALVNIQPGCYALCYEEDRVTVPKVPYGKATDDLNQARELFDALRRLDELGAKKVYARMPRKTGVGMAVYNRLIRAAAFRILDLTRPFLIGVTGPTGAGKGYVCRLLAQAGLHPVDCDRVYGQLTVPGAPLLQDLAAAFGQEIIKDGALDRKTLAAKAFATPAATEKLDQVTHPAVLDACVQQAKIPAVLDAPQLFESGADALCAHTLAVTAPEDTRLARIVERDGIDLAAAQLRMQAQPAADFYTEKCTFTVTNDGRDIKSQVDRILEAIL